MFAHNPCAPEIPLSAIWTATMSRVSRSIVSQSHCLFGCLLQKTTFHSIVTGLKVFRQYQRSISLGVFSYCSLTYFLQLSETARHAQSHKESFQEQAIKARVVIDSVTRGFFTNGVTTLAAIVLVIVSNAIFRVN